MDKLSNKEIIIRKVTNGFVIFDSYEGYMKDKDVFVFENIDHLISWVYNKFEDGRLSNP